ncbi:MAG TPA: M67 family metallopeptidase [Solirubrobacterales bacterium]|jgi:proteasome lid subunit RPN8/RPN11|nr:M67 family metallopeptidase [Solirubrobacterales bacterium]
MRIAKSLIDEMVAHAQEDLPNECCGMVGGAGGEASVVLPVVNSAASPLRFEMDPQGQYNALKAIEDDGKELLAIYHSHTKSPAYPSQTDVNQAVNWPDAIYLIVSLQDADAPEVKGYWLKDLKIADAELIVE